MAEEATKALDSERLANAGMSKELESLRKTTKQDVAQQGTLC